MKIRYGIPRLKRNTRPVCENRRSHELVIRREIEGTGKRFYECEICERTSLYFSNLNKHCRLHMGEKPYKFIVCGKKFSDKSNYDTHRRKEGMKSYNRGCVDERPFGCSFY